ncbi:hypothetical protein CLOM_g1171 [Closterium sp. NIES-68]|nr:hypothetical protein CLOM_g1171 [Closterium sp. NIES-68]
MSWKWSQEPSPRGQAEPVEQQRLQWVLEVTPQLDVSRSTLAVALADAESLRKSPGSSQGSSHGGSSEVAGADTELPVFILVAVMHDTTAPPSPMVRHSMTMDEAVRLAEAEEAVIRKMLQPLQALAHSRQVRAVMHLERSSDHEKSLCDAVKRFSASRVYIGVRRKFLWSKALNNAPTAYYETNLPDGCLLVISQGSRKLAEIGVHPKAPLRSRTLSRSKRSQAGIDGPPTPTSTAGSAATGATAMGGDGRGRGRGRGGGRGFPRSVSSGAALPGGSGARERRPAGAGAATAAAAVVGSSGGAGSTVGGAGAAVGGSDAGRGGRGGLGSRGGGERRTGEIPESKHQGGRLRVIVPSSQDVDGWGKRDQAEQSQGGESEGEQVLDRVQRSSEEGAMGQDDGADALAELGDEWVKAKRRGAAASGGTPGAASGALSGAAGGVPEPRRAGHHQRSSSLHLPSPHPTALFSPSCPPLRPRRLSISKDTDEGEVEKEEDTGVVLVPRGRNNHQSHPLVDHQQQEQQAGGRSPSPRATAGRFGPMSVRDNPTTPRLFSSDDWAFSLDGASGASGASAPTTPRDEEVAGRAAGKGGAFESNKESEGGRDIAGRGLRKAGGSEEA